MRSGIFLWEREGDGQVAPVTPEILAGTHPFWAEDVAGLGPWFRSEERSLVPGKVEVLWRSGGRKSETTVLVCGRCSSSMDVAWGLGAPRVFPDWSSIIAVEQVTGRGRWRRQWISPPGNLYVSWVWPPTTGRFGQEAHVAPFLSLVVGYMLASALEAMDLPVEIKWPNDLVWKGRKVGGILIEQKAEDMLVGIGLNLASAPANQLPEAGGSPGAASLAEAGLTLSPLRGWLEIARLSRVCLENQILGLSPGTFIDMLENRLAGVGRTVLVHRGEEEPFEARMTGLAPDGGLTLERRGSQFVLYSGSILFP